MKKITLPLLFLVLLAAACKKEGPVAVQEESADVLETRMLERAFHPLDYDYSTVLPNYLRATGLQPVSIDNAVAALGRVLFYDKSLSRDGSMACASCHDQKRAFADAKGFSLGASGQRIERQSLPLGNTASFAAHYRSLNAHGAPSLFWDGRTTSADEVARMAITSPREMNMTLSEVVERIRTKDYYRALWRKAFGHPEPKESEMLQALSEFVRAIGSTRSPFDIAMEMNAGDPHSKASEDTVRTIYCGRDTTIVVITPPAGFSVSEFRGLRLFGRHCSSCHSAIRPFQEVFEACNGLSMEYKDQGKGKVTGNPKDNGVFKSVSLRNVARTAPYMHDGRFKTLGEVIDFYSTGIQPHPNLHPLLRNAAGGPRHFNFSPQDKRDLVDFLEMLTDDQLITDARFSSPFKQ
ncbi:MAG: cytochrome c peroxidase [Saprospiraceae bacterium]|nr:hypothetical protein [Saprospiraceae bacterium]MDW8230155.1 cytochrome c peroxidase [Saprospiraceae bacterium]